MISLGFLALGAFVGGIIGVFLLNAEDWKNPWTGLTAVLSAAVAGTPITLAQSIIGDTGLGPALAMYPIGLVLGLMTSYLQLAADNWKKRDDFQANLLGLAHFVGYAVVVGFGVSVFFAPEFVTEYFGHIDQYFVDAAPQTPNPSPEGE